MKIDIRNLIFYIMALCLTLPLYALVIYGMLGFAFIFESSNAFAVLYNKFKFIDNIIFSFGMFCFIASFFYPMIVTKAALDKNWSKYVTYFYNHMQYPTIVLICYILIRQFLLLSNLDIDSYSFLFCDWYLYSIYFLVVVRKYLKSTYESLLKFSIAFIFTTLILLVLLAVIFI